MRTSFKQKGQIQPQFSPLTEQEKDTVKAFAHRWRRKAKKISNKRDAIAAMDIQPIITPKPLNRTKEDVFKENTPEAITDLVKIIPHSFEYDISKPRNEQPSSFLRALSESWDQASREINGEKFDLFFDIPTDKEKPKSEKWIAGLLLENCVDFTPSHIITPTTQKRESANNLVIVDDASYSGLQLYSMVEKTIHSKKQHKKIHVVIPYMSERAKIYAEEVKTYAKMYDKEVYIHSTQQVDCYKSHAKAPLDIKHTTIFSHKTADDVSLGGMLQHFTTPFNAPYKNDDRQTYAEARAERKEKYKNLTGRAFAIENNPATTNCCTIS